MRSDALPASRYQADIDAMVCAAQLGVPPTAHGASLQFLPAYQQPSWAEPHHMPGPGFPYGAAQTAPYAVPQAVPLAMPPSHQQTTQGCTGPFRRTLSSSCCFPRNALLTPQPTTSSFVFTGGLGTQQPLLGPPAAGRRCQRTSQRSGRYSACLLFL